MNGRKVILGGLLILLVIVIFVVGGIYIQKQQGIVFTENGEKWLTHKSEQWGFQFQYPSNYVLDTEQENKFSDQSHLILIDSVVYESMQAMENTEGGASVVLSTYLNPEKVSALQWAKENVAHSNFAVEYTTTQVDGRDAMFYSWSGLGYGDTVLLASDSREHVYSFGVMYMDENDEIQNDFWQIVKSIELLGN